MRATTRANQIHGQEEVVVAEVEAALHKLAAAAHKLVVEVAVGPRKLDEAAVGAPQHIALVEEQPLHTELAAAAQHSAVEEACECAPRRDFRLLAGQLA